MTVEVKKTTISEALDKKALKEEIDKKKKKTHNESVITKQKGENEKNGFIKNNSIKHYKNSKTNGLQRENQNQRENNTAQTVNTSQVLVNNIEGNDSEDDYFNILEGLDEEEEKRLRIQEYVNSLPQFLEGDSVELNQNSVGKDLKDKSSSQSCTDTRKTVVQSPYIMNNETLFSLKKNYSFSGYQLWKIKRDNEKIARRLQLLEKRKISGNFINNVKSIPSRAAVARENNLRKIEAENKTIEQEIKRIKGRPNKKAPWYKPEGPWYLKNSEKNKKK